MSRCVQLLELAVVWMAGLRHLRRDCASDSHSSPCYEPPEKFQDHDQSPWEPYDDRHPHWQVQNQAESAAPDRAAWLPLTVERAVRQPPSVRGSHAALAQLLRWHQGQLQSLALFVFARSVKRLKMERRTALPCPQLEHPLMNDTVDTSCGL
jgi:hypothetical protein